MSGLRLRVDRLIGVWDITANGSFLTAEEISKFLSHAEFSPSSREVVLPELPTIPERSSLYITVYGGTDFAEVAISGGSSRTEIKGLTRMEDNWFLEVYRNPWTAFMIAFAFILLLAQGAVLVNQWLEQKPLSDK